jgi:Uma2 family endonuclease
MGTAPASRRKATSADLAALPGDPYAEVIGGLVVEKASPSAEHGATQIALAATLWHRFHNRGGGGPGGWWIMTEVEVELESHEIYRPDLVGWRRDRVPTRPTGRPVRVRPDWVSEVLSASNADNDLVTKFRGYHRNGVPHYWLLDPDSRTLMVYRWSEAGYIAVLTAKRDETVRAEPFEAMELVVGSLFDEGE